MLFNMAMMAWHMYTIFLRRISRRNTVNIYPVEVTWSKDTWSTRTLDRHDTWSKDTWSTRTLDRHDTWSTRTLGRQGH